MYSQIHFLRLYPPRVPKQYSILSWRRSFRAFPWLVCTYTWSWRQTTPQLRQLRARPNYAWRGKMTRMIGLMTSILLIRFSPNQLFFIFATAGKATVDSALHHYIVFLAFTTICANPFIYGLSNADYRQRCKRVCFPWCRKRLEEGTNVAVREIRVGPARSESLSLKEENTTDMQSTLTAINQIKRNGMF